MMRDVLPEYYEITAEQRSALFRDGVFVFDGTALLRLYHLDGQRRDRLFELMQVVSERIWVPHAAAVEYHENRIGSLLRVDAAYAEISDRVAEMRDSLLKLLGEHPVLGSPGTHREVSDRFRNLERYLADQAAGDGRDADTRASVSNDVVLRVLDELLVPERLGTGSTGIRESAQERLLNQLGPGLRRPDGEYDGMAWLETVAHWGATGRAATGGLVWVTENGGDDWWRLDSDMRLGPRPELVREAKEAGLSPFWLTDIRELLTQAEKHYDWPAMDTSGQPAVQRADGD